MKNWPILLLSLLLAACANAPVGHAPEQLFNNHLFPAASERIDAAQVFALSEEMKHYMKTDLAAQVSAKGPQQGLYDALYQESQLKIEYDSRMTRNAAQAFSARSGNCLSMAIMTAAFAKELGLNVQFHRVLVEETWSRVGTVQFSAGHVNVSLVEKMRSTGFDFRRLYTIDFLPPAEANRQITENIDENTIVAMYMNNRAAELLASGQVNNAYWWASGAVQNDPNFLPAYNTLGAIYQSHGNLREAEYAFNYILGRDTENTSAMFNLAHVLDALGRVEESKVLMSKVEQMRPYPPFHFFDLGRTAMKEGNFKLAKEMFRKEVARAPDYHEFNFWLASAYLKLGENRLAEIYMARAMENSTTRTDHDLYAAKLDHLRAGQRAAKAL